MFANNMRKGQTGTLIGGWRFEVADNLKGVTRTLTVYGHATETGSTYIHEIATLDMPDGSTERIEFTPKQSKQIAFIKAAGF